MLGGACGKAILRSRSSRIATPTVSRLVRDHLDFLSNEDRDWLLFRTAQETLFSQPDQHLTASLDCPASESIRFSGG